MKKLLSSVLLLALAVGALRAQTPPVWQCSVVITGDFDSECIYDFKDDITDEYPNLMVACKGSTVTYTAHADLGAATASGYVWQVFGDVSHTANGDQVTVEWGTDTWGYVVVAVADGQGDTCTESVRVRLIDKPTVGSTTVPESVTMSDGSKVIRVCKGGTVQFIDQSTDGGSDIVGYLWNYDMGDQTSTPNFTIDNVQYEGKVVHRVYNNCGCYDEELYMIELLEGDVLELNCYGTVCKDAIVTYTALHPECQDYSWYVEGGTILDGQGTAQPTVQWDNPTDGYGVIGLDGVVCGGLVCPTLMSLKVPVIHDSLTIKGQTTVCEGEAVLFSLPLFGSTEYRWSISPTTGVDTSLKSFANEMRLVFNQAGTYMLSCSYRCDFLGCGPYAARPLTITVKPPLTVAGTDRICVSNACSLAVTPAVSAAWTAYDLADGNAVAATGTGSTFSHTFSHAGRYLVTAEHPDYCDGASFVIDVRPTPPAPTVADLDPANRHTACLFSSTALAGTPSKPNYMFVWEPDCTTATPQTYSGDSVTISYLSDVCDVLVYNYDMVLQCQSADYYVHTMEEFVPADLNIPTNITVCPGTVISWGDNNVPDQSFEGMLYEWSIEETNQRCASVLGSHFSNRIDLAVNEGITTPTTFYVKLRRTYCGNIHTDDYIYITVQNNTTALTITGPDTICQHDAAVFTGCCGNEGTYQWTINNKRYFGNPFTHSFPDYGAYWVYLKGHPYTYCTNSTYIPTVGKRVFVRPEPAVDGLEYNDFTGRIRVVPQMTGCTFSWWYTLPGDPTPIAVPGADSIPAPPLEYGRTYYCRVTDTVTGCSKVVSLFYEPDYPGSPCETIHFAESYNRCNNTMTLVASNYQTYVFWIVPSGCHIIDTYGDDDEEVQLRFDDVGEYRIRARSGFLPCYEGSYVKRVDFKRDFTLVPECNKVTLVNNSHYLSPGYTVYIRVTNDCNNNTDIISMPVGLSSYTYTPSPSPSGVCNYTFSLVGYGNNGNINQPCTLGVVAIGSPTIPAGTPAVTIKSDNLSNPNATCNNTPIKLTAELGFPGGAITSSNWNFGDGSTFNTNGDNIYHTFGARSNPYNVTVSVVDNYGCTRTMAAPLSITSVANPLNGILQNNNPMDCPNTTNSVDITYTVYSPYYEWWRHKDLTHRPHSNPYPTYRTDDYFVYVINDNYCQHEASTNVAFLNAPTATIYADNFNCCEGDELTLYGQQGPSSNTITYSWVITDANNNVLQTSTDPNITFTATQGTGTYNVTLTVADNNCSSTATETITVNAKPAAPTIAFNGSPCISNAPVRIAATGYTGEMHWSNGGTGATADYYTHGMVSAYYYDPAIGCASDTAKIRIDRQPDFGALLTGCYEKCYDFFGYYLPVWGLTDDSQEIDWEWLMNGNTLSHGHGEYYHAPLQLPLQGFGNYRLDVSYGGNSCTDQSPMLTLDSKELCDCDSVEVTYTRSQTVENCHLLYTLEVTVCNHHVKRDFCPNSFVPLATAQNFSVVSTDFTPTTIAADDCYTFEVVIEAMSLEPRVATFTLSDISCMWCTKTVSFDLMPQTDCDDPVVVELVGLDIDDNLSSSAVAYFNFTFNVSPSNTVLAFWSEPPMVVDWLSSGMGVVSGLGMMDMAQLSQLVYDNGEICFYAIVCDKDEICMGYICISAEDLYEMIVAAGVVPGFDGDKCRAGDGVSESTSPYLKPNPTTGKVTVVGVTGDVVEVVVMDMNGRKVAVFNDTEVFDIHNMSTGSYIVRIRTENGDVTYLKLIKQ